MMTTYLTKLPYYKNNHIEQWKYGAKGCKPTTIRTIGIEPVTCREALREAEDQGAQRPREGLIGKDPSGGWKTSSAKEYPPLLGRGLARLILLEVQSRCRSQLLRPLKASHDPALFQWALETDRVTATIDPLAQWRPDFQG